MLHDAPSIINVRFAGYARYSTDLRVVDADAEDGGLWVAAVAAGAWVAPATPFSRGSVAVPALPGTSWLCSSMVVMVLVRRPIG